MKVIFLDVDGVMNGARNWPVTAGRTWIDPEAVKRLNQITTITGAVIVVTSTWRTEWDVRKLLVNAGVTGQIVGETAHLLDQPRGDEIDAWLTWRANASRTAGDGVESFVILDDDADMGDLSSHLVKTKWAVGLEDEHVVAAISQLTLKSSRVRVSII